MLLSPHFPLLIVLLQQRCVSGVGVELQLADVVGGVGTGLPPVLRPVPDGAEDGGGGEEAVPPPAAVEGLGVRGDAHAQICTFF